MLQEIRSSHQTTPVAAGLSRSDVTEALAETLVSTVRQLPGGIEALAEVLAQLEAEMPGLSATLGARLDRLLTPVERGRLRAGEPLPVAAAATQAMALYTVRAGDTLSEIAAAHGTSWQALARANNLPDPDVLRIGQRLVIPAGTAQPAAPAPPPPPAAGAAGVSDAGLAAIFAREAQAGVSSRLHWPGGASGVTLGAGYDLKGRSAEQIIADLTAIGLDRATAGQIARGAGLSGTAARDFAVTNRGLVDLTRAQKLALLARTVEPYAQAVRAAVRVPLNQNQFDALVSLAYNIGAGAFAGSTVVRRLNEGDYAGAADAFRMWNKSGGEVLQGLVNRREAEIRQFNTPAGPARLPTAPTAPPLAEGARPAPPANDIVEQLLRHGDSQARADFAAGRRVVVAFRTDTNVRDNPNGRYDDRIAVVWRAGDGRVNVREFAGNTEPSGQYAWYGAKADRGYGVDMNGDGRLDLGRLVPGSYRYTRQPDLFLGNTYFRPDRTTAVERDSNGDGWFDSKDPNRVDRSGAGRSMLIHQGGAGNSWSAGCQTIPAAQFDAFVAALGGQRSFSYVLIDAAR